MGASEYPKSRDDRVPAGYTKQMQMGRRFDINKGQLNKFRIRPGIINEHAESSREAMGTVIAGVSIGQIFKASSDNIHSLMLTLESAESTSLDDFEGYASDAALQAVWVESVAVATRETVVVKTGTQAMNLPGSTTVNATWIKTVGSTDYTGYSFEIDFQQTHAYTTLKYEFFVGDGTNTKSIPLTIAATDTWTHFDLLETAMVDDQAAVTTIAAITKLGIRLADRRNSAFGYMDNLNSVPGPGSVELELWDCGASLPASGGTYALTDGVQYDELGDRGIEGSVASSIILPLSGGKKLYYIQDFNAGLALENPDNSGLTVGNYYAITINYVDTSTTVYGPNTAYEYSYYNNGYSFSSTAPGANLSVLPGVSGAGDYSDLMFGVLSNQKVYVFECEMHFNDSSGNAASPGTGATWVTMSEDADMKFDSMTTYHAGYNLDGSKYADKFNHFPVPLDKGGKFEVYYNDNGDDEVSAVEMEIYYLYVPNGTNG